MTGRLLVGRLDSSRVTSGTCAAGTIFRTSPRPGTLRPGIVMVALAVGPLVDVTAGALFGVVTETLPGLTLTEAPVPGTEAPTDGMAEDTIGSGGIGSSTLAEGTLPEGSTWAEAPAADAFRPAAEAVTVALLGAAVRLVLPPTKA